jgi:hypothetical protein
MPAIILAAVLAAMPGAQSPLTALDAPPACANGLVRNTADDGSAQVRKLGELPPAVLMHAVLREAGGCDLAEVRFAGAWRNLPLGAAPFATSPAGEAPPSLPRR